MKLSVNCYMILLVGSALLQDFLFSMERDDYAKQKLLGEQEKLNGQKSSYNEFSNFLRKGCTSLQKEANQNLLKFFTGKDGKEEHIRLWEHLPFEVKCEIALLVKKGLKLKTVLKSGRANVSCVKISSDEKQVVIGYDNGQVKLWDAETGELRGIFKDHKDKISCIDISLNGQTIVTGSFDYTVKVWNAKTRQKRYTFNNPSKVFFVGIISDEKNIVICLCDNGSVIKWNPETAERFQVVKEKGCFRRPFCFNLLLDRKQLVIGCLDGKVELWDTETCAPLQLLKDDDGRMYYWIIPSCIWDSHMDVKKIVTGSFDHKLILWNAEAVKQLQTLEDYDKECVDCIKILPNGKKMTIDYDKGRIKLLNVRMGMEEWQAFKIHGSWVSCADGLNGQRIVTASRNTANIWEISNYSEYEFPLLEAWRRIKKEELSKEEIFKNIKAFLPNILYNHDANGELVFLRGNAKLLLSYLQNRFPDDDRVKRFKLFMDQKKQRWSEILADYYEYFILQVKRFFRRRL